MTNYSDRIAAAERRFGERMKAAQGETLRLALKGLTGRAVGVGEGEVDPVERVYAEHTLAVLDEQAAMERLANEHEELTRRPPPHMKRADYLAKLEGLAKEHSLSVARLVGLKEKNLAADIAKATEVYAAADAEAQRVQAIRKAAEARADELASDVPNHAVEMAARAIANKRGNG